MPPYADEALLAIQSIAEQVMDVAQLASSTNI
jgi:hypothetical protein